MSTHSRRDFTVGDPARTRQGRENKNLSMSRRELKVLLADRVIQSTVENRSRHCRIMSDNKEKADPEGKLQN